MSESETWKDVAGYDGRYQVSDKGNVRSVARKDSIGRKCGGLTLRPSITRKGYLQVQLYKNGIMKHEYTHRLVAEAFVENPNNLPKVNHKDEIKTNNQVSNLEWCDTSYNNNHGTRNRRISKKISKKVRAVNVETGEVLTFSSGKEAKIKEGYSRGCVSEACRGIYYGGNLYKGHQWSYERMES